VIRELSKDDVIIRQKEIREGGCKPDIKVNDMKLKFARDVMSASGLSPKPTRFGYRAEKNGYIIKIETRDIPMGVEITNEDWSEFGFPIRDKSVQKCADRIKEEVCTS